MFPKEASDSYCSRDIHLQFKKLPRTVIWLVTIHRRARAAMLISMDTACYCFPFLREISVNEPKQMQEFASLII